MDLIPIPIGNLLRRIDHEWRQRQAIFDLPGRKFHRATASCDTAVTFHGERAASPLGPAAGPQSQLAQNVVLSWLAGGRIIELKTVQINDRLEIPRPCIDAQNVGYNVEWSQELRIAESTDEYAKSWLLLHWLAQRDPGGIVSATPGAGDFLFDLSVGYDLEGIRSPQVAGFIRSMQHGGKALDAVRAQIPAEFAEARDLEVPERIIDCITLSTFHGCPAHEIEGICRYLLEELDVHVVVKMNPTLLGYERVSGILHDDLGYHDIALDREAFKNDLQFDQALEIVGRLRDLAASRGRTLGCKFSNTLVVKNHKDMFSDKVMYMSGAPLHAVTINLVDEFRRAVGPDLPISFSAGIDARNFPDTAALGFTPVTVCTDLLRPGGYGRLPAYVTRLSERMAKLSVSNLADYAMAWGDHAGEAAAAALAPAVEALEKAQSTDGANATSARDALTAAAKAVANAAAADRRRVLEAAVDQALRALGQGLQETPAGRELESLRGSAWDLVVARAAALNGHDYARMVREDTRYHHKANATIPRKIGSSLLLFDCVNCDKCVPVCPNDSNFSYTTTPRERSLIRYTVSDTGTTLTEAPVAEPWRIGKAHQLANFADACNECGNCDVFCPEDGGPFLVKPRFFGSLKSWKQFDNHGGLFVEQRSGAPGTSRSVHVWVRIQGQAYQIEFDRQRGTQHDGQVRIDFRLDDQGEHATGAVIAHDAEIATSDDRLGGWTVETRPFHEAVAIAEAVLSPETPNPVNAPFLSPPSRPLNP